MQLNELHRPSGLKKSYRRVGRGQSSKRGKTSGRGTKGQNARAGRKKRPEWRDIIKKLPKRRGYGKNRARTVIGDKRATIAVSLARIESTFASGAEVNPKTLAEHFARRSGPATYKIVGAAATKALTIRGCAISAPARSAVEKAGGRVE